MDWNKIEKNCIDKIPYLMEDALYDIPQELAGLDCVADLIRSLIITGIHLHQSEVMKEAGYDPMQYFNQVEN